MPQAGMHGPSESRLRGGRSTDTAIQKMGKEKGERKMDRKKVAKGGSRFIALGLLLTLTACGSSGDGDTSLAPSPPGSALPASRTVVGTLDATGASSAQTAAIPGGAAPAAGGPAGTTASLDRVTAIPIAPDGRFEVSQVNDGDHSLFVHLGTGETAEIPFRMLDGRGIDLGTVRIRNGHPEGHSGFDGYRFGFVDENGDGVNDNFADADGDGICDNNVRFAGYPYMMDHGYADRDRDGVNDLFRDADGDGINDITGMPYVAMPGWVDLDGDSVNDFFQDADGDGICALTGIPYGHGFGWKDDDHDGRNDRFTDVDGDTVVDAQIGPHAGMHYRYGSQAPHVDTNGDGIDDGTGEPFRPGFGWAER